MPFASCQEPVLAGSLPTQLMTHQQEVAERLAQLRREKAARERRDVTQAMVAADLGIVPETYSRYENGRRKVPEDVIEAAAKYFGVTRSFLRYGEESSAPVYGGQVSEEAVARARAKRDEAQSARKRKDGPSETPPHSTRPARAAKVVGDRRRPRNPPDGQ